MDSEYEKRINAYSLEELNNVRDHVDRDKYPERYSAVLARIDELKRNPTLLTKDSMPSKITEHETRLPTKRDEQLAIASVVVAIVSVGAALGFVPISSNYDGALWFNAVSSGSAIVLGWIAFERFKASSDNQLSKGLAIAAMILGVLTILPPFLFLLLRLFIFFSGVYVGGY